MSQTWKVAQGSERIPVSVHTDTSKKILHVFNPGWQCFRTFPTGLSARKNGLKSASGRTVLAVMTSVLYRFQNGSKSTNWRIYSIREWIFCPHGEWIFMVYWKPRKQACKELVSCRGSFWDVSLSLVYRKDLHFYFSVCFYLLDLNLITERPTSERWDKTTCCSLSHFVDLFLRIL